MPLIKKLGENILKPILHFIYVMKSKNVSFADKAKICGAIAYIVIPTDLIPDFIPLTGWCDDLAGVAWAFHTVRKNITPEIKEKTESKLNKLFNYK